MTFGFQVFDAQGRIALDTTMRTGRILGSVVAVGTSGQVDVPPVVGTPFFLVSKWPRPNQAGQFGEAFIGGNITFDGSLITWNFSDGGGPAEPTTIYYGSF